MDPKLPADWQSRRDARPHPTEDLVACPVGRGRLKGGVGVWRTNGDPVVWFARAHRLTWLDDALTALVVYQRGHRSELPLPPVQIVARVSPPEWAVEVELSLPVTNAGCAIEEITSSASGRWAATLRFSGQGECGFDVIDVASMERMAGITEIHGYILDLPAFSADEMRVVVACIPSLGGWWAHPDDELEEPARGGVVSLGTIYECWLPTRELRACALEIQVPEGWLPQDPWAETWYGPTALEPLNRGVRMILPGGDPFEHPGPLPTLIQLPELAAFG